MVPKARWYYDRPFITERGVTQGYPAPLTVFNIMVGAVARKVMMEVYVPQEKHHGMGWAVGEHC